MITECASQGISGAATGENKSLFGEDIDNQ